MRPETILGRMGMGYGRADWKPLINSRQAPLWIAAGALVAGVSAATATGDLGKVSESTRPSKQYTIEQFLDTESVVGMSFSYDAKRILYSSNRSGIFNAYVRPVTGGEPTAIPNRLPTPSSRSRSSPPTIAS